MRLPLALLLLAAPAAASPRLQLCLPFAPKSCALTKESQVDDYFQCFRPEMNPLDRAVPEQNECFQEIRHARVHKYCDPEDVPRVCGDVKPGNDRLMTCLRTRKRSLGASCRNSLEEFDRSLEPFEEDVTLKLRRKKKLTKEEEELLLKQERKKGRNARAVSAVRC